MKPVFGRGLSVLRGIFALTKNRHFTGVLRGCWVRTKAEQDKAGSLGPASPHRPATPVGDYGYVKGIPLRFDLRSEPKSGVSRLFQADFQAKRTGDSGSGSVCGHGQMPGS